MIAYPQMRQYEISVFLTWFNIQNNLFRIHNYFDDCRKNGMMIVIAQLWVLFFINISHFDFAPCEGFLYYYEIRRFHGERSRTINLPITEALLILL